MEGLIKMKKKLELLFRKIELFLVFNVLHLLKPKEVTFFEARNQDVLVKVINKIDEGNLFIRYQYLPKEKQILIESTYRSKISVKYVEVEGLFSDKKFQKIIKEHSQQFIRDFNISGLSASGNLSINPENAIF